MLIEQLRAIHVEWESMRSEKLCLIILWLLQMLYCVGEDGRVGRMYMLGYIQYKYVGDLCNVLKCNNLQQIKALDKYTISVILVILKQVAKLIDIGGMDSKRKDIIIMSKIIESSGKYTVKETGASVDYDFTYRGFDDLDDAIEVLGEAGCLKCIQRMEKVDANNTSREKAKTANGHSTRAVMSEEEKAEKKIERAGNKKLLEALKANPELLAQLQG